jgi:hypothetical protein
MVPEIGRRGSGVFPFGIFHPEIGTNAVNASEKPPSLLMHGKAGYDLPVSLPSGRG